MVGPTPRAVDPLASFNAIALELGGQSDGPGFVFLNRILVAAEFVGRREGEVAGAVEVVRQLDSNRAKRWVLPSKP